MDILILERVSRQSFTQYRFRGVTIYADVKNGFYLTAGGGGGGSSRASGRGGGDMLGGGEGCVVVILFRECVNHPH